MCQSMSGYGNGPWLALQKSGYSDILGYFTYDGELAHRQRSIFRTDAHTFRLLSYGFAAPVASNVLPFNAPRTGGTTLTMVGINLADFTNLGGTDGLVTLRQSPSDDPASCDLSSWVSSTSLTCTIVASSFGRQFQSQATLSVKTSFLTGTLKGWYFTYDGEDRPAALATIDPSNQPAYASVAVVLMPSPAHTHARAWCSSNFVVCESRKRERHRRLGANVVGQQLRL